MKVYFKNLDGLRFIAALFVILQHESDYKAFGVPDYSNVFRNNFSDLGRYGVTLFFVLSGFLISYLLFAEKVNKGDVNVKKFYIRRVLRIWPLYFAFGILLISSIDIVLRQFGINEHTPVLTNLLYLATFTINFQLIFGAYNRGIIEVLWSVCIEEQFYAIWPWTIKFGYRYMKRIIFIFIGIGIASTVAIQLLTQNGIIGGPINPVYIFTLCRFGHFGIGAYAAYLLFNEKSFQNIKRLVTNKGIQAAIIALTLLICFRIVVLPKIFDTYLFDLLPALLFAFIILAAASGNFIFNLEKKWLKRLGTYSYGIYIIHPTIGQLSVALFKKYVPNSFLNYEIVFPLFVVLATIGVAALSYELYEKRFLLLKQKFAVIKTQPV